MVEKIEMYGILVLIIMLIIAFVAGIYLQIDNYLFFVDTLNHRKDIKDEKEERSEE